MCVYSLEPKLRHYEGKATDVGKTTQYNIVASLAVLSNTVLAIPLVQYIPVVHSPAIRFSPFANLAKSDCWNGLYTGVMN